MIKKIFIIILTTIIIITIISFIKINKYTYTQNENNFYIPKITTKYLKPTMSKEKPIGKLIIKKIEINHNLYKENSKENNVEKNITILNGSISPEKNNSIFFLAAHSGTGEKAFFKDLDKIKKNDLIILIYKDIKYEYIVNNIWETNKNGSINVEKTIENQLILTTCSPNKKNYQLIINCTKKETI